MYDLERHYGTSKEVCAQSLRMERFILFVVLGLNPSKGFRCRIPECDGEEGNFSFSGRIVHIMLLHTIICPTFALVLNVQMIGEEISIN